MAEGHRKEGEGGEKVKKALKKLDISFLVRQLKEWETGHDGGMVDSFL